MSTLVGCRMCAEKCSIKDLSKTLLLCQNCDVVKISQTYKQCKYCRSDYKSSIDGSICPKCKSQLAKHGEPSPCTICNLKMAYGTEVICVRCSHYRSKFGDPKQCDNCCQFCAFYKDESSRQKVDGKLLCWLCTYFYKFQKAKALKASKRKADVPNIVNTVESKNFSNIEPVSKMSRMEESMLPQYSNDAAYNEQLLKVSTLQEEVKELRRKVASKEAELLNKDNVIAGLKADLIQREKDTMDREIVLKNRWDKEKGALLDKLKQIQKNNIALAKGGKKKKQSLSGFDYLTRDPLTRPPSISNLNASNSPKPEAKVANSPKPESRLSVDSPKIQLAMVEDSVKKEEVKFSIDSPDSEKAMEIDTELKIIDPVNIKADKAEPKKEEILKEETVAEEKTEKEETNNTEKDTTTNSPKDFDNESSELSLNSNSKDNSSAEVSPKLT